MGPRPATEGQEHHLRSWTAASCAVPAPSPSGRAQEIPLTSPPPPITSGTEVAVSHGAFAPHHSAAPEPIGALTSSMDVMVPSRAVGELGLEEQRGLGAPAVSPEVTSCPNRHMLPDPALRKTWGSSAAPPHPVLAGLRGGPGPSPSSGQVLAWLPPASGSRGSGNRDAERRISGRKALLSQGRRGRSAASGVRKGSLPSRYLLIALAPSFWEEHGAPLSTLILPDLWHQLPLCKQPAPMGTSHAAFRRSTSYRSQVQKPLKDQDHDSGCLDRTWQARVPSAAALPTSGHRLPEPLSRVLLHPHSSCSPLRQS